MKNNSFSKSIIPGVSLLLGLSLLGLFIYNGFKTFSDKDRVVTVKGLAEMNLKAISATIELKFSISGDDLQGVIRQADNKKNSIVDYLTSTGFDKGDIRINNVDVTDQQRYYNTEWVNGKQVKVKIDRYTISQSITIESKDVTSTEDVSSRIKLDLVTKNLTSELTVEYTFPELNTIKPQLIAESTRNARIAGEQFANDSKAKLGKIKTASQGQISVGPTYAYDDSEGSEEPKEPYLQKARVVSTIVFFLE